MAGRSIRFLDVSSGLKPVFSAFMLLALSVSAKETTLSTNEPLPCPSGRWTHYTRAGGGPDNDYINDIAIDDRGVIYLATNDLFPVETHGGGLSLYYPDGRWEHIHRTDTGLRSNTLYAVEAHGAILQVGGIRSLDVLRIHPDGQLEWRPQPAHPVDEAPLQDIGDILHVRGDHWFFATSFGLFEQDGSLWHRYGMSSKEGNLPARFFSALEKDGQGNIWAGTMGQGLFRRNAEGAWTHFDTKNSGLGNDYIYAIEADSKGRLWVGTGIGVSVKESEGQGESDARWTVYTSRNSPLLNDDVRAIAEDTRGRIWLGTNGGISVFDNGRWRRCPAPDNILVRYPERKAKASLSSKSLSIPGVGPAYPIVVAIAVAPDGAIWFGTFGGGVSVFEPEASTP